MKTILYFLAVLFVLSGNTAAAQLAKPMAKDTTVNFKVFGACEQCKARIENAAKGRGVKKASWDVDSKILQLTYSVAQTSLEKIQHRIVSVGHDLENKKANDNVYKDLPSCCHYREMETMMHDAEADTVKKMYPEDSVITIHDSSVHVVTTADQSITHFVKGVVLESSKKGEFTPLHGASVIWLHSKQGVSTDSNGVFQIHHDGTDSRLIISYAGYQPDTLTVTDMKEMKIILAADKQLKEVTVLFQATFHLFIGIKSYPHTDHD